MSEMRVERNKVIYVTYFVSDEKGEIIERVDLPVSYVHGRDSGLFDKIEQALEGKSVGDSVEVSLSPAEGFGEWNPEFSFSDAIENVPPDYRRVGAQAEFVNDAGETITMIVTHVDGGTVTLDGNHQFAGKTVTFNVKVSDIRDATPEEMKTGVATPGPGTLH